MLFKELAEEFLHFFLCFDECFTTGCGRAVGALGAAVFFLGAGPQEATLFHGVQHGIDGSGADLIAVAAELMHDAESEDGFLGGMMQDAEADHTGVGALYFC